MKHFVLDWSDLAQVAAIFAAAVLGFGLLSAFVRWPDAAGWPFAITIALVLAMLPIIVRTLNFLQQNRASLEAPFGIKLNFANAALVGEAAASRLPDNLVQAGVMIPESGRSALEQVAAQAAAQPTVIIDLEDGGAWYITRIFAVAATAMLMGTPRAIVLVGQVEGRPRQVGGWIRPQEIVAAMQREPGYDWVLRQAKDYLWRLRSHSDGPAPLQPPHLPMYLKYHDLYRTAGDATVMRVLYDLMHSPVPAVAGQAARPPLEDAGHPPWATLSDMVQRLSPWLKKRTVDLGEKDEEQLRQVLESRDELVVATRDGVFAGVIDVQAAERQALLQLIRSRKAA